MTIVKYRLNGILQEKRWVAQQAAYQFAARLVASGVPVVIKGQRP